MKADGSDVKDRLKGKELTRRDPGFKEWLVGHTENFLGMIPKGTINVDRFVKSAAVEIVNNPKLMACTRQSIAISLGKCAQYGLEPGPLLGQAWLIPYNESRQVGQGKWEKQMTCHFQMGYRGLIVLARRSNTIKTISTEVVYETDIFEVELGMGRHLTHKIDIREERGEPIAYYCLVELTNGGEQFAVMSKKDVEKHRDRFSKAYNQKGNKDSVWDTDFDSMALKTVVIRTLKLCPISVEAMEAVRQEERGMRDVTPENTVTPKDVGFDNPPNYGDTITQDSEDDEEPPEQTEHEADKKPPQEEAEKPRRGRPPKDSGAPIATPPPEEKKEDMGLF